MSRIDHILLTDLYLKGVSLKELSKTFNVCRGTINNHINKLGLEKRKILITEELIKTVKETYLSGLSVIDTANKLGIDRNTISKILCKENIKIIQNPSKYDLMRFNPFLKYDDESYYWIGYLAGDGYISKKKEHYKIMFL